MIRPVLIYGNQMLSQKSANVPDGFPKLNELIDDMYETMHKADGVGMSAVQLGVPLNIFVVEIDIDNTKTHNKTRRHQISHFRKEFVNPIIIKEFGTLKKFTEGCLSLPYIYASVERCDTIEIEYFDKEGIKHQKTYDGIGARVIQHEMDHLKGTLFIDKLSTMWKQTFAEPLRQIKNREIPINYLHK
jgi:peptide deformylase